MKYAFISAQSEHHYINRFCLVLNASTSGYYDRPLSSTAKTNHRFVIKTNSKRTTSPVPDRLKT